VANVAVASIDNMATASLSVSGAVVTINLADVASAQTAQITLGNVDDGTNARDVVIAFPVLVGDANGDKTVNSGDAQQTRNRSGQATDATNFRSDFNLDGTINSGDAIIVRSRSGQFIP